MFILHFRELDKDGDGKISVVEFTEGFRGIRESLIGLTREQKEKRRLSCSEAPHQEAELCPEPSKRRSRGRRQLWEGGDHALTAEEEEQHAEVEAKVRDVIGGLDESFATLSW